MSDVEVGKYIDFLEKYEAGESDSKTKDKQLKKIDPDTNAMFEKYGQFAMLMAKNWYEENKEQSKLTLGDCIHAANTGLIMAHYLYKENHRSSPFRLYAKPSILQELERLK